MTRFPLPHSHEPAYAIGVGSALVDIMLHESDEFREKHEIPKGSMEYLSDSHRITKIVNNSQNTPTIVPGGSACNTMIGLGQLCGKAGFAGCCGKDEMGTLFQESLCKNHVEAKLMTTDVAQTGRVLSVVTPDAQRSMLTYLGASSVADPAFFTAESFGNASLLHVEGYLLFNEVLLKKILTSAKEAQIPISLDLASVTMVEQYATTIRSLVRKYVDIVLANEDEARAYAKTDNEEEALSILSEDAPLAVVKLGKRGSMIKYKEEIVRVAPVGNGTAIDTTGAGDLWASGFLYGIINKLSLEESGKIASLCGYEVCQVTGARIPDDRWKIISDTIKKF